MRISDWSSDVCSSDLVFLADPNFLLDPLTARGAALKVGHAYCVLVAHPERKIAGGLGGEFEGFGVECGNRFSAIEIDRGISHILLVQQPRDAVNYVTMRRERQARAGAGGPEEGR